MGAADRPAAARNGGPPPAGPARATAARIPRSRPWCDDSQRAGPPRPMLLQRLVDHVVEPAGLRIPLDLLVPQPLGILRQPGTDAGQLVRWESLNCGGDLLDCTHRRLAFV